MIVQRSALVDVGAVYSVVPGSVLQAHFEIGEEEPETDICFDSDLHVLSLSFRQKGTMYVVSFSGCGNNHHRLSDPAR